MGTGNPYKPICQNLECLSYKRVVYVLKCKGRHHRAADIRSWFHQRDGNVETYWACEDCIKLCPVAAEFTYIEEYQVKGLTS